MRSDVIEAIYRQVGAPEWASPNLDGLADVLRDLSWLPPGPVVLTVDLTGLDEPDARALRGVLAEAVDESADSQHPLRVTYV